MAMCVFFCGFAKGFDFFEPVQRNICIWTCSIIGGGGGNGVLQPVQRNICIWTCFIIGAGGGNGVESTVLFPFMFGKAASHGVVEAYANCGCIQEATVQTY